MGLRKVCPGISDEIVVIGLDCSAMEPFLRSGVPFIRSLKQNLLWVHHFAIVAELIEVPQEFKRRYNEQWLIERYGYCSPAQVRRNLTALIPAVA